MTSTDPAAAVPAAQPVAPIALLLGLAGGAWIGTLVWAHQAVAVQPSLAPGLHLTTSTMRM